MSRPEHVLDTECYRNYWLCLSESGIDVEIWDGQHYVAEQPVDAHTWRNTLFQALQASTHITFNGIGYDMPLVTMALEGATTDQLKNASDAIIIQGLKPWEVARVPDWIDHIDLIEVAPGQGSLKAYAAKMHSRRLHDLPIEPHAIIGPAERQALREYCRLGDLPATRDLFNTFPTQLDLRRDMSVEYGIDVRSKSDAQIAEAVMKALLPFKVQRPAVAYGSRFHYRPPEWLQVPEIADLLALLARNPFTISDSGSPTMTEELEKSLIHIGSNAYQMGSGGLHSTEKRVMHVADAGHLISDHDVASYYPSLIIRTGIYPQQIGPIFLDIYRDWYTRRIAAKSGAIRCRLERRELLAREQTPEVVARIAWLGEEIKKLTKLANSLKTLLNGTFGKLGSPWSIFYAPSEMIQVTITGQLALLLLIRRLVAAGIEILQANTDGIVLKTPAHLLGVRDAIVALWEHQTGLETEATQYRILASRDVNSYMAVKPDGEVKAKGAFAAPEPGPSGWPNPTGQISVDAAAAWLRDGTPVEQTVRACTDIRQFVHVKKVTGGGSFCPLGTLPKKTTQIAMRRVCGEGLSRDDLFALYEYHVALEQQRRQYLGKTVRWYYARGSAGCIVTPKGGLVGRTEGCRPLMELSGVMPPDVDHDWYIREARDILIDMGAIVVDGAVN